MTVTEHTSEAPAGSWALVEAAKGGDRDAFARLYRDYAPAVAGFVRRRVRGDQHLTEDLTSETFLRALRNLDSVRYQGRDVGAWFTTIARNLITDHYKSSRTRSEHAVGELPEPHTAGAGDGGSAEARVVGQFDRDAAAVAVRAALEGLTPDRRRVIELYHLGSGGQLRDVADQMGRSVGAVKSLHCAGLHAMREQLAAGGLTSRSRCVEAVGQAREAVEDAIVAREHAAAQRRDRIAAGRRRAADRWVDESVAATVGEVETAGAGVAR